MPTRTSAPTHRRLASRVLACAGAAALLAGPLVAASSATAQASTPLLKSANIPSFPGVLENSASRSLYVLSTEKGAKLHCTSASCLKLWKPIEVKSSVKSVSVGSGVKGKIGFVKRTSTMKQVTFNTYPIYTYTGDTGANQSHGEAIGADGGTWDLVHAAAKSAGATRYNPALVNANIPGFNGVLENTSNLSLYVLSVEKGTVLKCTGACTSTWPPLLVPTGVTKVTLGAGVKGTIGFVTRSSTMKQVTFNSYPVYTYTGDVGPNGAAGQGVVADGGTWTLVNATATTAAGTPVTGPGTGGGW